MTFKPFAKNARFINKITRNHKNPQKLIKIAKTFKLKIHNKRIKNGQGKEQKSKAEFQKRVQETGQNGDSRSHWFYYSF